MIQLNIRVSFDSYDFKAPCHLKRPDISSLLLPHACCLKTKGPLSAVLLRITSIPIRKQVPKMHVNKAKKENHNSAT